jgi:hypothetical protein
LIYLFNWTLSSSAQVNWNMYPNPASESTQILFTHKEIGQFELLNTLGKNVMQGKFNSDVINLSLDGLQKGVYYIRLIIESEQRVHTKKIDYSINYLPFLIGLILLLQMNYFAACKSRIHISFFVFLFYSISLLFRRIQQRLNIQLPLPFYLPLQKNLLLPKELG